MIDVIQQHHGTSLVYYFYRRALAQQKEIRDSVARGEANEEDVPEVREPSFRYPGPRPRFRESAIISLADAVERMMDGISLTNGNEASPGRYLVG